MPTLAELAISLIWVGSYIILGSNVTYPSIFMPVDSLSFLLLLFVLEETYYGFSLLFLTWVSIRLIILSHGELLSHAHFYWTRWLVLLLLGVTVSVLWTRLDLIVRLYLSDEPLRKCAQSNLLMLKNPPLHVNKSYLKYEDGCLSSNLAWSYGFFTAYDTFSKDGVVWFTTVQYGPPFSGGLCYSESGKPPQIGESTYQHLFGPWWRWLCDI